MRKFTLIILCAGVFLSLMSCTTTRITRVEEDVYTITMRDTIYQRFVNNAPGNRDNGEIFPSSRTFKNERDMLQIDSIVTRKYPDFIRYGLFESVGLMGTSSENGMGVGMFGIFPDFKNMASSYEGNKEALFTGGIYRLGFFEKRLRWFRDAKNWTWGWNALEVIAPSALTTEQFWTLGLNGHISKRYYLRDEIPYIAFTITSGIGLWPSMYANVSGSLDIGSIGGLNLRAYAGLAGGMNPTWSPLIKSPNNPYPDKSVTKFFPYIGLGVSVLDFHNLVEETETEWKDHEHSSWNVGFLQFGLLSTGADASAFSTKKDSANFLKGMSLRLANTSIAIPILNNKFYAGTSLINLLVLGQGEWGLGVLPIRIGYFQTVLLDELSVEPFIEYNYYPSSFFNIGGRLNLVLNKLEEGSSGFLNISLLLGFASGSTDLGFGSDIVDAIGLPGEFSRAYIGLNIGIWDRIFFPEQLRYNK
ncbi:MAG: hypothetical protein V1779_05025 [bacterium]